MANSKKNRILDHKKTADNKKNQGQENMEPRKELFSGVKQETAQAR